MPELPEVETMRRGVLSAEGGVVVEVRRLPCRKRPLRTSPTWRTIQRHLRGNRLQRIGRHGKRLLLHFQDAHCLVIEPRMSGLLLVDGEPTREHLRFEIHLRGAACRRLAYWDRRGLGQVFLMDTAELRRYLAPERMGPDALEISAAQLSERLRLRSVAVKVGLLDQKAVAGIGNIYASEILHLAGVDPRCQCRRLPGPWWPRIHQAMLQVLHTAIDLEGSTLSDGTYRNALNDPGRFQNHHRVYDRAGDLCLTCMAGPVQRIVQAGRSTYFCRYCQKRR